MPAPVPDLRPIIDKRNRTNDSRKKTLDYHKQYNEEHADELAASKKKKYDTDPDYKAAAKKRASAAYQRQKLLKEEIRKVVGPPPPKSQRSPGHLYCPTCMQAIPRPPRPVYRSVGKKYAVAMFTIRELARRLGKQVKTVQLWIRDGVLPDTIYKDRHSQGGENGKAIMTRMWTQDQIEMLMQVFDKFDLRPPVSFEKIGLLAEIKKGWDALRPMGIRPELYTEETEQKFLARPSAELPSPSYAVKKKAGNTAG